jgi:hypothetical protein
VVKFLFPTVILAVFLLSCNSQKGVKLANHELNSPAFSFERTACFGTCPEYKLTVNFSGEATLEIAANLELEKGKYRCTDCDEPMMAKVIETADEIGFWEMEDVYDPGVTDLPSAITTIYVRDTVKKVVNVMDGPEKLQELQDLIDDLYLKREWEKL